MIHLRAYLARVFLLYVVGLVLGHVNFEVASVLEDLIAFLAGKVKATVSRIDVLLQIPQR